MRQFHQSADELKDSNYMYMPMYDFQQLSKTHVNSKRQKAPTWRMKQFKR